MIDGCGRTIDYMRISVTDLCNLRCRYCMPEDIKKLHMKDLLSFEEIRDICRAAVNIGITKFKFTGGEPLVRNNFTDLYSMIMSIEGVTDGTLTTNGVLLSKNLKALVAGGLRSVNISLDTLDRDKYQYITGKDHLKDVLNAIEEAVNEGLHVKVNSVLQTGINENEWKDLISLAKDMPVEVRFIEMMPIGHGKDFTPVSNKSVLSDIKNAYGDYSICTNVKGNGPAEYVKIPGFKGAIGFISAINNKFCGRCNRIRLTSTGKIKPCLCFGDSLDLLSVLRSTDSSENVIGEIEDILRKAVLSKPGEHAFESGNMITETKKMAEIGG